MTRLLILSLIALFVMIFIHTQVLGLSLIQKECQKSGLSEKSCELMKKQIHHESAGTYDHLIIGDGGCSWGFIQFNACVHLGLSRKNAGYIAKVFDNKHKMKDEAGERVRLLKYAFYFHPKFQLWWIITKYHERTKWCDSEKPNFYRNLNCQEYYQIRLHNWNGGNNYLDKVLNTY